MLAAIIANLQNVNPPGPTPRPPTVKIDRGGGGPLWGWGFDIVDIGRALDAFREIPGEHPVARAARRTRHVGEYLHGAREQRERREAAAFLAGAALAESAAEERITAAETRTSEASIRELITIVDEVRAAAMPRRAALQRGQHEGSGAGIAIGLGIGALVMAIALSRLH